MKLKFLALTPFLILFGAGIFFRTTQKYTPQVACSASQFSGLVDPAERLGVYNGKQVNLPNSLIANLTSESSKKVLSAADPNERWIEVDLSEQKLKAWDGNNLFLETLIASGLPWWPTPTGEFRIWTKMRATKMEGGEGRYYYYLPNVPYVMFFENDEIPGWRGFSLHGTYWHNEFGTQRSHGCVNLPTPIAEQLYYWVTPALPAGKSSVFASPDNPGTRIIIHE